MTQEKKEMGLYNAVFGYNPQSPLLLEALGLAPEEFRRFRDAFVADDEIVVYTRLGGGNRPDYQDVFEKMKRHPLYLRDADDKFDSTYCSFFFRIPLEWKSELHSYDIGRWDPDTRWKAALQKLEQSSEVERVTKEADKFLTIIDSSGVHHSLGDLLKSFLGKKK